MWAAWIADGRETTAEIRGAEDHDVRRKQRQDLGLRTPPAFCGLALVFGSKLVSCDAAGLPFGMVSEPRRRLEPTLAGGLVEYLAVKMYFRVLAEFLELCQQSSTSP